MSNVFVFIFSIIALVGFYKIVELYIEKKGAQPADVDGMDDALGKLDQLEERIRVLERIVTENRPDLKRMIDDL